METAVLISAQAAAINAACSALDQAHNMRAHKNGAPALSQRDHDFVIFVSQLLEAGIGS
jgi:hypothetical protein